MKEATQAEGVNAERVSRLATRALAGFDSVVGRLTRKGRPKQAGDDADHELALTRALLGVATSILQHVKLRKDVIRSLVVGSYLHLRATHPQLTQKRFCQTLAVPTRTLRSWLKTKPMTDIRSGSVEAETTPRRKRDRPPRRGRFDFAVTIPDTQLAGDTTDLRAFGVGLKLIATQD